MDLIKPCIAVSDCKNFPDVGNALVRVAEGHGHDSIPPLGPSPRGRGNFRKEWEMGDVAWVYQDRMCGSPR